MYLGFPLFNVYRVIERSFFMERKCLRCGNTNELYFYDHNGVWYCRKCVNFGRLNLGEFPKQKQYQHKKLQCDYRLKYPLTKHQLRCQKEIMRYLQQDKDVLVYAACGAGKTELVMACIKQYLHQGKKVGYAISRRQVVLEIKERMQEAFHNLQVIAVCEGFTDIVDGDLIICTMHQLYRYYQTFDLLIMDEVDAFPYRGNDMLHHIAKDTCIGRFVYLTATPDVNMRMEVKQGKLGVVELFQRPHGYPLIVPAVISGFTWYLKMKLFQFLKRNKKMNKQVLVFLPTIAMALQYQKWLSLRFACAAITSKTKDKDQIIQEFHEQRYDILLCTTILERGITIKGVNVVIMYADHMVFEEASLIQMIGRVGRSIEMPTGEGLFLCHRKTDTIRHCIYAIQKMNEATP